MKELETKIDEYLIAQKPGEMRAVQFFNFKHEPVSCSLRLESESNEPRVTYTASGSAATSGAAFDAAMQEAKSKFGGKF